MKTVVQILLMCISITAYSFDRDLEQVSKPVINIDTGKVVEVPVEVEQQIKAVATKTAITTDAAGWGWDEPTATTKTGNCDPTFSWADGNLNEAEKWMVENCAPAIVKADIDLNNAYHYIKSNQIPSKTSPNIFVDNWFRDWVADRDKNISKSLKENYSTEKIQGLLLAFYQKRLQKIQSELR